MRQLTLDELLRIMRECAGEDENLLAAGGDGAADVDFSSLGYDSLALLETATRVSRDYGVELAEDELGSINTPGDFIRAINRRLAAARA
jgi:minimal PKS acyl carrier protein